MLIQAWHGPKPGQTCCTGFQFVSLLTFVTHFGVSTTTSHRRRQTKLRTYPYRVIEASANICFRRLPLPQRPRPTPPAAIAARR